MSIPGGHGMVPGGGVGGSAEDVAAALSEPNPSGLERPIDLGPLSQTQITALQQLIDLRHHAADKLARKGADLIVANDVSAPGVGFEHDTNAVVILTASGREIEVPLADKDAIAHAILDAIVEERG